MEMGDYDRDLSLTNKLLSQAVDNEDQFALSSVSDCSELADNYESSQKVSIKKDSKECMETGKFSRAEKETKAARLAMMEIGAKRDSKESTEAEKLSKAEKESNATGLATKGKKEFEKDELAKTKRLRVVLDHRYESRCYNPLLNPFLKLPLVSEFHYSGFFSMSVIMAWFTGGGAECVPENITVEPGGVVRLPCSYCSEDSIWDFRAPNKPDIPICRRMRCEDGYKVEKDDSNSLFLVSNVTDGKAGTYRNIFYNGNTAKCFEVFTDAVKNMSSSPAPSTNTGLLPNILAGVFVPLATILIIVIIIGLVYKRYKGEKNTRNQRQEQGDKTLLQGATRDESVV